MEAQMYQDERIARLRAEVRRLNGGEDPPSFGIDSMPKEMTEQFLKRIIAIESGQTTGKAEPLSPDGKVWHIAIPTDRQSE
jgi:hypothetical protein